MQRDTSVGQRSVDPRRQRAGAGRRALLPGALRERRDQLQAALEPRGVN
jgi:hypothetical protein